MSIRSTSRNNSEDFGSRSSSCDSEINSTCIPNNNLNYIPSNSIPIRRGREKNVCNTRSRSPTPTKFYLMIEENKQLVEIVQEKIRRKNKGKK
jgi:hypothetical protein|tara:strand:- start:3307 stop:3585 length:279 start_codon:yes stop_codon:yes gene_type:complete